MAAVYDRIGRGYDATRRADGRITAALIRLLAPRAGGRHLDLACGSGNYTAALAGRGVALIGVDRSAVMLAAARGKGAGVPLALADAMALPFADGAFDGALCTLASHHFADPAAAFAEVARVLRGGRLVLFTATAEQMRAYWLDHYFPVANARAIGVMRERRQTLAMLTAAGFTVIAEEPFFVPDDLRDLFLYAGKRRPEMYFDPRVRAGISFFAKLCDAAELTRGLARLRADLDSGHFAEVAARHDDRAGDYLFIVAEKRAGAGD